MTQGTCCTPSILYAFKLLANEAAANDMQAVIGCLARKKVDNYEYGLWRSMLQMSCLRSIVHESMRHKHERLPH